MAQVNVTVPVLVQLLDDDDHQTYHLSPLFFAHPVGIHRRYDQAVAQFKKEVQSRFKGYAIGRENANYLLWYLFNPVLRQQTIHINTAIGKQLVKGAISVLTFELKEHTFCCLPGFGSFVFVLEKDEDLRDLRSRTLKVVEKLIRVEKKAQNNATIDVEPFFATKGEFVTTLEFKVNVKFKDFAFAERNDNWFFAFFGGNQDFDGADELEKVGVNLNEQYPSQLLRAFEREEEVAQVQHMIYQSRNTPIVIVGKEGVGKHSLMHEVIHRYCKQWTSPQEKMQYMWHVNPNRIIAGMSIVGMWQKRMEAILQHLKNRQKGVATDKMLLDNVVALLRIGKSSQNSMTLSDVLKPYLEKRLLQVVLIATPEEWKIVQEKDRRFADLFQVLRLQEPHGEQAVRMVLEYRKELERQHGCRISIPAIRQLFTIHRNYFKRRALPGSVCKMLNQLAVKHSYDQINVERVQASFETYSGLSSQIFDSGYIFEEQEVRQYIGAGLIGQPAAVECLANAIHTIKAKLNNPSKPLGSFFFIGPTGVGKTEAAKIVCQYLLGDSRKLMRFDMNEYIDAGAVSRLIGDYYNPEGQLTGKVRYNPFGVVLLDEIEKAHPKIHDLLLQVLDDGRLTDSLGRTVDFSNTLIIMTSNIGATEVGTQLGFDTQERNDSAIYRKAVENFFRPEFINRIDQTVIFSPLEPEHIFNIAKLQIQQLLSRDGFVRRTTILNISEEALAWVAKRGYNAKMGGRALKRQIEKDLTAFSAQQLTQITPEQPIILNIELEEGVFKPSIDTLEFAAPLQEELLPDLPNDRQVRRYYQQLLDRLSDLQERLMTWQDHMEETGQSMSEDDRWFYYDLREQITEQKEHASRMLMGFRSPYLDRVVATALRLKSSGTSSIIYKRDDSRIEKKLIEQQLFSQSALDELRYVYQNAPEQFDRYQSMYLNDWLNVLFLEEKIKGLESGNRQRVRLYIQSAIRGQGNEEIKYLKEGYEDVLDELGYHYEWQDHAYFEIEGYGLMPLLYAEQGYHLFYRSHQNSLPMRVYLTDAEGKKIHSEGTNFVVRLYDITLGDKHKASTLTDLRTGYTNQAQINAQEYKLLLYASWVLAQDKSMLAVN